MLVGATLLLKISKDFWLFRWDTIPFTIMNKFQVSECNARMLKFG